jgi:hypothetical protein
MTDENAKKKEDMQGLDQSNPKLYLDCCAQLGIAFGELSTAYALVNDAMSKLEPFKPCACEELKGLEQKLWTLTAATGDTYGYMMHTYRQTDEEREAAWTPEMREALNRECPKSE